MICDYIQEHSGVRFEKEQNLVQEKKRVDSSLKVLEARLYFQDFYGKKGNVIISVGWHNQFDRIHLPIQNVF